ncbi:DBIRD complex subunit like [Actinidia chinensis var. chinensis]|uniref:DBIRD complex subunit like n=1 Tax=Actinidia chinensis var. chinensis TaxID=1590841 RepID=A0A2R6RRB4_ACTCC|nr:DBIRD complex subunit like [Actinidia chinensis var. chinensis]
MAENKQHRVAGVGGSSSSFTMDLFGPKDSSNSSSSSSTGLFSSVFGPESTGLGKASSHSGITGRPRKLDLESQYGNGKHGTPENFTHRDKGETVEPCYFSSSIYYGGQEIYSPSTQTSVSQNIIKKDAKDDDPNGSHLNIASRGNWWQGSLYY